MAQRQPPQGGPQNQMIERAAMATITLGELGDDAVDTPLGHAVLPDGEGGRGLQALGGREVMTAGKLDGAHKGLGEGFPVGETHHGDVLDAGEGKGEMQSCASHVSFLLLNQSQSLRHHSPPHGPTAQRVCHR